jgi:hypothetical protein
MKIADRAQEMIDECYKLGIEPPTRIIVSYAEIIEAFRNPIRYESRFHAPAGFQNLKVVTAYGDVSVVSIESLLGFKAFL